MVDLVFERRMVGRDFDGNVDVVRQVFASRDLAVEMCIRDRLGPVEHLLLAAQAQLPLLHLGDLDWDQGFHEIVLYPLSLIHI